MRPQRSIHRYAQAGALVVLVAGSFLLFAPVLGLGLLSDDFVAVWRSGVNDTPWRSDFFRPLSDASVHWGYLLHGASALGYRCFNVALHGVNAWLAWLLCLQLAPRAERARTWAWMSAILFLVYPFHLESIIWIVGRESSLAAGFTLLGILLLGTQLSERTRLIGSSGCLLLGALCYESAWLLPLMVLPVAWVGGRSRWPSARGLTFAFLATLVLYVVLRAMCLGHFIGPYGGSFLSHPFSTYLLGIPKLFGRSFLPPDPDASVQLIRVAGLVAVLGYVGWRIVPVLRADTTLRRLLGVLLWWWVAASVLAMLGGVSTRSSESDRFLYLPSALLAMVLALVLCEWPAQRMRWVFFGALMLAAVVFNLRGQANWRMASARAQQVITTLPDPPPNGRLFVTDLPLEVGGAFIYRNGFPEALLLAGRDTARIVQVRITLDDGHVINQQGDSVRLLASDRLYVVERSIAE